MNEKNNAKYAFYYLLALLSLIFIAISVGLIIFGIINETVVDALALNSLSGSDSQFKFAISALLIATPIFFIVSKLINRGLSKKELSRDSGVRRWLTYFILLVSFVIILGVFIGVINSFLAGELTIRFILKAVAMFFIAASVFSFYFYDIRRENVEEKDRVLRLFFVISLFLVTATFVAAWFFVESPKEARERRLDEIVVQRIYNLESAVNTYYDRLGYLPETMADLKKEPNIYFDNQSLIDPETGAEIIYQITSEDTFEFCAYFRTNNLQDTANQYNSFVDGKEHESGYDCVSGSLWTPKEKGIVPLEPSMQTPKTN